MSASAQSLSCTEPADAPAILVVEDEILIRGAVAEHLRGAGFRVIEAANADEAVDVLQSGEPVELVFTDIAMPGSMNGGALARWVRLHRPDIRVVLASGSADRALPNARLFLKPYDLAEVESHIRRVLDWA